MHHMKQEIITKEVDPYQHCYQDGHKSLRSCVGLIMDGNRRFARQQKIPLKKAYKQGALVLRQCAEWARQEGFTDIIAFAFSSDNWKRHQVANAILFDVFLEEVKQLDTTIQSMATRPSIRFIGEREHFSPDVQEAFADVEQKTKDYDGITIWIAVSYNGRKDIVRAAQQCVFAGEVLTEESVAKRLSTHPFPNPQCIIRTGGAQRLSGFLLWESEYSELLFSNTLWPAFTHNDFQLAMKQFHTKTKNNGM